MGTTEDAEHTENTENANARVGHLARPALVHGELSGRIRQTAFEVHEYFGSGFLERVYENALAHRLRKQGHDVINQAALVVRDQDETVVGEYVADLLVDGLIVVEIKAVSALAPGHHAQILTSEGDRTTGRDVVEFRADKIASEEVRPSMTFMYPYSVCSVSSAVQSVYQVGFLSIFGRTRLHVKRFMLR